MEMAINANVIRPCFKFWANEVRVCLYTGFSTFEMDPSTPLNIILVKLPNLKVIRLLRNERRVAKIYRRLYVGWQVCAPHHTNSCKISRL